MAPLRTLLAPVLAFGHIQSQPGDTLTARVLAYADAHGISPSSAWRTVRKARPLLEAAGLLTSDDFDGESFDLAA